MFAVLLLACTSALQRYIVLYVVILFNAVLQSGLLSLVFISVACFD